MDEVESASPLHVKKDWKFLAVSMQTSIHVFPNMKPLGHLH